MKKTTVRESFLTPKSYKIVGYLILVGIIITLILPLLHFKQTSNWINDICFLLEALWFCTFLQKRHVNVVLAIILSATGALIISVLLALYILLI